MTIHVILNLSSVIPGPEVLRTSGSKDLTRNLNKSWIPAFAGMTMLLLFLFPHPAFATNSGNFTMSLWINPTTSVASKTLVGKAEEFRMFTDASGFVGCQVKTTTWQTAAQASTKALVVGTWSQVNCAYDLTSLKVYVDGTQVASQTLTSLPDDTANLLKIGQDDSTSTPYSNLSGTIDEFKFYNYALTKDEILTDYNRGSTLILGATGNNSTYQAQAANQEYCIPGDTTSCAGPVGEWKFEEKTGTSANDTSGNGNAGTLGGDGSGADLPTWTTGKYGGSLSYDGSDDYISANSQLVSAYPFTISAWIKTTYTGADHTVLSLANSTAHDEYQTIQVTATNGFALCRSRNPSTRQVIGTTNIADGKWHLITCLWNSATDRRVYVDGVHQNTDTNSVTYSSNTNSWSIGRLNDLSPSNYFQGAVDEVKIYNYARTPAQIAWDYNRGKPVGWWKMDECQGGSVYDSSGNNNTGTINLSTTGTQTTAIGNGTCTTNASTPWYNGRTGKFNSSLNFDGNSDYVDVGNGSSLNLTGDFSISAWVKRGNSLTGTQNIFNKGGTSTGYGLQLTLNQIDLFYGTSTLWRETKTTNTFTSTADWYHIVATHTSGAQKIYVNGVLQPLSAGGSFTENPATNTNSLLIGKPNGQNDYYFTGQIDDVRVYNYALTTTQVKDAYNNGAVFFGPNAGSP